MFWCAREFKQNPKVLQAIRQSPGEPLHSWLLVFPQSPHLLLSLSLCFELLDMQERSIFIHSGSGGVSKASCSQLSEGRTKI